MNSIKQVLWLLIAFSILMSLGWYCTRPLPLESSKDWSASIDSIATGLKVRQFNTEGQLIHSLTTPLMQHSAKGNVNWFFNPHIVITQKGESSWDIRSKKAKSLNNGERIVFLKQVVVHQKPNDKTQESTLKTEKITYFPQEKRASTDQLVTYTQPGNWIQSIGMNAYLEEKKVELLHQARGRYVPAKG